MVAAELHDAAQVHDGDAVGDVPDHRQVVSHEQVGHAQLVLQVLQQVDHARLDRDVQRGDRFVEQHQLGVDGQGARDGDALTLATGELRREAVDLIRVEFHQGHQIADAVVDLLLGQALHLQRLGQNVVDRQTRVERAHRVLEDVLHVAVQLTLVLAAHALGDRLAEHGDLARFGLTELHDLQQRGGLSGAGLAHQGHGLPLAHVERHIVDGVHLADLAAQEPAGGQRERLLQMLDVEHGLALLARDAVELRFHRFADGVDVAEREVLIDDLLDAVAGGQLALTPLDRQQIRLALTADVRG